MRKSPGTTRRTRQRDAIEKVIEKSDRPLGLDEILAGASQEVSELGIATVYRAIKLLAERGQVISVEVPGVGVRYELSGKAHHHHFHCDGCGRTFDLHTCPFTAPPALPDGFSHETHAITIFGKCDTCGRRPRSPGRCTARSAG
jgi:Fur family ferric uptake transcriptional regulator